VGRTLLSAAVAFDLDFDFDLYFDLIFKFAVPGQYRSVTE
jgi:hypothetical protein